MNSHPHSAPDARRIEPQTESQTQLQAESRTESRTTTAARAADSSTEARASGLAQTLRPRTIPSVGMTARIEALVLPGSELELAPLGPEAPFLLRIVAVQPHGDAFRYDLEYWGLEPGVHDLRTGLQRTDRSSTADLPPLEVEIASLLVPGRVEPHEPIEGSLPRLGGYSTLLAFAGGVWLAILCYALLRGRRRTAATRASVRPLSLAELLRPLVERAARGELDTTERARLELGLLRWWQRRLGWDALRPDEALALLRTHAEAGPLLRGLENWLHRPKGSVELGADDLAGLLRPYRDLTADEFTTPLAGQAAAEGASR
jgi:hypothetical protein